MTFPFNARHLSRQREFVTAKFLPDRCTFRPKASVTSVNVYGNPVTTPAALRTYNGSTSIPCRLDIARAFRPDQLKAQIITVDEYVFTLPFDFDFEHEDTIMVGADEFKIKRVENLSEWSAYREVLATRTTADD